MNASMLAQKARQDEQEKRLLAQCLDIVSNRHANVSDQKLAIDTAYDLGFAAGRLAGKIELGEQLTGMPLDAAMAKLAVPS